MWLQVQFGILLRAELFKTLGIRRPHFLTQLRERSLAIRRALVKLSG